MTKLLRTTEPLARYRRTLRARAERDARALAQRKRRAWDVARQAARVLVDEHGATRVMLFGSLAHGRWYATTSDIDLAAWGLDPDVHLLALARLEDLGGDLPVTVVRAEHCGAGLLAVIEEEGIEL